MDTLLGRDEGPEMAALWSDAKRHLRAALNDLTPREERILRLRYGLDGVGEHLHRECDLGVTVERNRQIEAKALRKLKHPSRLLRLSRPWSPVPEKDIVRVPTGWSPPVDREALSRSQVVVPPYMAYRPPDFIPLTLDVPVFFTSDVIRQAATAAALEKWRAEKASQPASA